MKRTMPLILTRITNRFFVNSSFFHFFMSCDNPEFKGDHAGCAPKTAQHLLFFDILKFPPCALPLNMIYYVSL